MILTLGRVEEGICAIQPQLPDATKSLGFSITQVGRMRAFPTYRTGPMRRKDHHIFLITEGRGAIRTPEATMDMVAGDIVVLFARVSYEWWTDKQDLMSKYWIGLNGPVADYLLDQLNVSPTRNVLQRGSLPGHELITLQKLLDLYCSPQEPSIESLARVQMLFYQFYHSICRFAVRDRKQKTSIVEYAKEIIDTNFDETITLTRIAESVGVVPEHLSAMFRRRYGVSPYSYLIGLRIERARELLCSGISVKEVARSVGYENVNYFSRLFRAKTGLSPSEVQRRGSEEV